MNVTFHHPMDREQLQSLIRSERKAKQRDRYRAVLLALEGHDAPTIAAQLARSRRFVQDWVYAYRDSGIEAVAEKPRPGRPTKLPRDQE